MKLQGKRMVMTGATGFLGRHVARCLLAEGAQVYALVRPDSKNRAALPDDKQLPGTLHVVDCAMEAVESCAETIGRADGFLHFAWAGVNREEIDSPVVQAANVDASVRCVKTAHALGCRFFLDAGSRVEYGITEDGRMEESMECHPVNAYGAAKLEFYRQAGPLCRKWGMNDYHLRFFSVYGPGDHPWSIISTLVRELPEGGTVSLSACRHRWNFMYIDDAADAVTALCERGLAAAGEWETVNVASADTRVLREFVEEIHEICGRRGSLEFGTFVQAKEGALSICPEIQVLKRLTAGRWQERVSFGEGIRRMLAAGNDEVKK